MEDSIFSKIIIGEVPCHKVFEDKNTFAFMDIHPIQPGQVLVVSKRQVGNFYELGDSEYQDLMRSVKLIAKRLAKIFADKKRVAMIIEGLDVDHVHVKLFPISTGEELRDIPDMSADPDHDSLAELAAKIAP